MADFNSQPIDNNKKKSFTIRDAFDFILYNWYWFAISIIVFTALGVLYSLSKPNIYRSSAMVLIDSKFSRTATNDLSGFTPSRLLYNSNNTTEDELIIMGSRTLMTQVVSDLNSNISYSLKSRLKYNSLYAQKSPVELIVDTICYPFSIRMLDYLGNDHFSAELEYQLPGQSKYKKTIIPISGRYGQTITDTVGIFRLERRQIDNFTPETFINTPMKISVQTVAQTTERYKRSLSVAPAQRFSNVVTLSITNTVPQLAADAINKLIEVYNEDAMQSKRETARATINFIDERLASVEIELDDVDSSIEKLKSENASVDIVNEARIAMQTSKDYEKLLIEAQIQLEMTKAVKTVLESPEITLLPVNIGIMDQPLASAIKQYNDLVLTRMNLGENSSDENPIIRELNSQIASFRSSLGMSIDNYISSLSIRISTLQAQIETINNKVGIIPTLEKETVSILRNQKIKDALYTFLLNKREEAALSLVATTPVAQVIDPAIANTSHVAPHKSTIVIIFFIIGLILPALLIYLLDQLRIRVGSVGEIEKSIQVPIIGAIPSKTSGMRNDKIVSPNSRDVITEAFRMVRTNLDFTMPQDGKVIMVTSSMPGEGKSFVSINLSLTLGIAGKKVLLVDLDLRKASLSEKISGKRQTRGLVNYLVRKDDSLEQLISHDAMHNVDVLYVGVIPPNPAELLVGDRIYDTFQELKTMYDYIVVDTPPVGLVTDTMLINRIADITVFSVRVGRSFKRNLDGINVLNHRKALHNLNVIITDIGAGKSYTKDSSTYGYGYGYGYGYDIDKKPSLKTRLKLLKKKLKNKK